MPKVSELFVETLKEAGVRHVFGIPSVHNIGLYDALRDEPSIQHILCRHESSATHMADGYARAGAGPGVVITSTGPGSGYMIPPLMEAWWSSSPVLALTTNIATDRIGKKSGILHEVENQDSMFREITKMRFCPRTGDAAVAMVRQALAGVSSERPGPVYLEVPTNLWDHESERDLRSMEAVALPPARADDLDRALSLLHEADRPLVIAGTGALRAGIGPAVQAIAEVLQAPVVTNAEAKGVVPEDHPLSFGNGSRRGVVREVIESSTVALALGTRLRHVDYARQGVRFPRLIHAESDDTYMGRNHPLAVRLTGSLEKNAEALLKGLAARSPESRRGRGSWVPSMRDRLRREEEGIAGDREEVAFLEAIRRVLPRDGTLVIDNTILGYWAEYFYPSHRPGGIVDGRGSSVIGFSFPAAMGLKLADPRRPVAALIGDGGFFYGTQELATCRRHGIGFPLVVVNDRAFGVIDILQRLHYGRGHETSLVNPDLQAFASSFGIASEAVHDPKMLEEALERAFNSGEMYLIELVGSFGEIPFARY